MATNIKSTVYGKVTSVEGEVIEGDVTIKKSGSTDLLLTVETVPYKDQFDNDFTVGEHTLNSNDYPDGIELTEGIFPGDVLLLNISSQSLQYRYNGGAPVTVPTGQSFGQNISDNDSMEIAYPVGTILNYQIYNPDNTAYGTVPTFEWANPPSTIYTAFMSISKKHRFTLTDTI